MGAPVRRPRGVALSADDITVATRSAEEYLALLSDVLKRYLRLNRNECTTSRSGDVHVTCATCNASWGQPTLCVATWVRPRHYDRLAWRFLWSGVFGGNTAFVRACARRARRKEPRAARYGAMQPVKVHRPGICCSVDFVGPHQVRAAGNRFIITAVTVRFSKWAVAV